MKDEIRINEYVRTKKGKIGKFKKYLKSLYFEGKDIELENYIIYLEDEVVKHSFNIIDLIEVGDYVNGHKVVNEIYGEDDNNLYFEVEGGFNKAQYIGEKDIKSIITKEQIKQIEYRIGERIN